MSDPLPTTSAARSAPLSRESVAALLVQDRARYSALLRRRLRGKLAAAVDLDDVMSSAFRRVDELCARCALRACSPGELAALTLAIAQNLARAHARARLTQTGPCSEFPEGPSRAN